MAVQEAIDSAFAANSEGDTIGAVLVVSGGELVVEEYEFWDPEAYHPSWSMAKSITSALVGILEGRDEIDVFAPAAAPEWSDPADPRHEITLDALLRMSSGLEWNEDYDDPQGDVLTILGGSGAADRAGYAASKPLAGEPDTTFYYSTGTANIVAREVAQVVGFGDEYAAWMDANLFQPLGIEGAELQIDDAGVINGGSWVAMRPVDFARFGYLFLRGGRWDGEQILPTTWVDYSRLPTPTADEVTYGAHWWLYPDHPGWFYASGFNGQSITVVPEDDLVVVVLSNTPEGRDGPLAERLLELFTEPEAASQQDP
ncbi:MAG: serine hydrolase [Microthrixaceae bacterium]